MPSGADEPSRLALLRDYTPQHLAEKILASRSTIEGERKQVTVLFADIKGSMELIADRDAEQAQTLMGTAIEAMMEAVHRYDGTVNQVLGDGIMALFGAPLASEDHAVHACYAALRMQENVKRYAEQVQQRYGIPFAIRVGLNSGEIVVRIIGNDLRMEYSVVGQTAHLASRMEQMAKPGSVLTTAETARLAEGYVDVTRLDSARVKGLAEPIAVYEVTGAGAAQTRLQATARRGLTSFVNRVAELEELRSAQRLAETGETQVAAIVAEPGVGKSRLLHEFLHPLSTDSLILHSSPPSYCRAISYLPVIELLKQYFRINPHDTTQEIRAKASDKMLALDPSLQDAVPPILDLLDSLDGDHPFRSLDPFEHRRETYQAVIRLLLTESRKMPKPDESHRQAIIAIFEDLHWYDSLSIGLLNELVVQARNTRLLLVVSYRPEFNDQWRSRPNYRQLRVYPLMSQNLAEFLDVLVGSDPSLQGLKSFLTQRASGNPFFVEEIVRTLVDTGVVEGERGKFHLAKPISSIDVPPSVHAVLAARIDRLPAAEKQLMQQAAVIGQDIPFNLLREISRLSEEALRHLLDKLQAAEFIYTTQLFPDLQYTFKHSLICDVAYSGVLSEHRRTIHASISSAMESVYADRLAEQVERLAYHSLRGELKEKAVLYLRQAGAKAAVRGALQEARTLFEQALDVLKSLPESVTTMEEAFEIRLEFRPVLRQLGEGREMLDHLRKAEAISEQLKDDHRLGRVCAYMTTVLSTFDEINGAIATGNRALEIAARIGELKLEIIATSYLAQAHYYGGDYDKVVELATQNLQMLPPEWDHQYFGMAVPASIFTRVWLIMSLAELGRFEEAAKYDTAVIQLAETTKHEHTIGWAYYAASMLHLLKGDWARACTLTENWLNRDWARDNAEHWINTPWLVASSAWALARGGRVAEALSRAEQAEVLLDRQAAKGIGQHRSWAYAVLGRVYLLLDRRQQAQRLAERAVESSRHLPGFAAHALHLQAELAFDATEFDADRVAAVYREVLALAEQRGMRPLIAHCHFGLAQLYRRAGNSEFYREHVNTATNLYRDMNMPFWLTQAEQEFPDL